MIRIFLARTFRRTCSEKYVIPSIARILVFVFICTNILFAHKPAVASSPNVWESRKKSYEVASLPASFPAANHALANRAAIKQNLLESTPAVQSVLKGENAPKFVSKKRQSPLIANLPENLFAHVNIREVHKGAEKNPIVLIEDIHQNLEAQTHISQAILSMGQVPGSTPVTIALEGAAGKFVYPIFHEFPDQNAVKEVADSFLQSGDIGGPAHAGFTSYVEPGLRGLDFIGVETPRLYRENVAAYKNTKAIKKKILTQIAQLKATNEKEKNATLNSKLMAFDRSVSAHREGQLSMVDYAQVVMNETAEPSITLQTFFTAAQMEKSLNFDQVDSERVIVLEKLVKTLKENDLKTLIGMSVGYQEGTVTFGEYYSEFRLLCEKSNIDLSKTPELENYIRYVLLSDGIQSNQLIEDLSSAESRIFERLAETSEEKNLIQNSNEIFLARQLVNFAMTSYEWRKYDANHDFVTANLDLKPFEKFYLSAEARSDAIVQNLPSQAGVLVAGGYHTLGLTEIFKKKNLSYVVVTPKITKVESENATAYLSVFDREKTSLEKIFNGKKLFVPGAVDGQVNSLAPDAPNSTLSVALHSRVLSAAAPAVIEDQSANGVHYRTLKTDRRIGFSLWGIRVSTRSFGKRVVTVIANHLDSLRVRLSELITPKPIRKIRKHPFLVFGSLLTVYFLKNGFTVDWRGLAFGGLALGMILGNRFKAKKFPYQTRLINATTPDGAFTAEMTRVANGSGLTIISIFNARGSEIRRSSTALLNPDWIKFSKDGSKLLIFKSGSNYVGCDTGEKSFFIGPKGAGFRDAEFSPDGASIVTIRDGFIEVWPSDDNAAEPSASHKINSNLVQLAVAQNRVAVLNKQNGVLLWWPGTVDQYIPGVTSDYSSTFISLSPRGNKLAVISKKERTVRIFDTHTKKEIGETVRVPFQGEALPIVAWSPMESLLCMADTFGHIFSIAVRGNELVFGPIDYHDSSIRSLSFNGADGLLTVVDVLGDVYASDPLDSSHDHRFPSWKIRETIIQKKMKLSTVKGVLLPPYAAMKRSDIFREVYAFFRLMESRKKLRQLKLQLEDTSMRAEYWLYYVGDFFSILFFPMNGPAIDFPFLHMEFHLKDGRWFISSKASQNGKMLGKDKLRWAEQAKDKFVELMRNGLFMSPNTLPLLIFGALFAICFFRSGFDFRWLALAAVLGMVMNKGSISLAGRRISAVNKTGQFMLMATDSAGVSVVELKTGKTRHTLRDYFGGIVSISSKLAFGNSGQSAAMLLAESGRIYAWPKLDGETNAKYLKVEEFSPFSALAITSDGKSVFAAATKKVYVFDAQQHNRVIVQWPIADVRSIALSKSRYALATWNGRLYLGSIENLSASPTPMPIQGGNLALAFSGGDGEFLAVQNKDNGNTLIFRSADLTALVSPVAMPTSESVPGLMGFHPDNQQLATVNGAGEILTLPLHAESPSFTIEGKHPNPEIIHVSMMNDSGWRFVRIIDNKGAHVWYSVQDPPASPGAKVQTSAFALGATVFLQIDWNHFITAPNFGITVLVGLLSIFFMLAIFPKKSESSKDPLVFYYFVPAIIFLVLIYTHLVTSVAGFFFSGSIIMAAWYLYAFYNEGWPKNLLVKAILAAGIAYLAWIGLSKAADPISPISQLIQYLSSAQLDIKWPTWLLAAGLLTVFAQPRKDPLPEEYHVAAMSKDGDFFVAKSDETNDLLLINARSGRPQPLRGHHAPIKKVVFSDTGRFVSVDQQGAVILWSTAGSKIAQYRTDPNQGIVAISPDGEKVVTFRSNTLTCTDVQRNNSQKINPSNVGSITFGPDDRVGIVHLSGQVSMWELNVGGIQGTISPVSSGGHVYKLVFNPANKNEVVFLKNNGEIGFFDFITSDWIQIPYFLTGDKIPQILTYDKLGKQLAIADDEGHVYVVAPSYTGQELRPVAKQGIPIVALQFTSNGRGLVGVDAMGTKIEIGLEGLNALHSVNEATTAPVHFRASSSGITRKKMELPDRHGVVAVRGNAVVTSRQTSANSTEPLLLFDRSTAQKTGHLPSSYVGQIENHRQVIGMSFFAGNGKILVTIDSHRKAFVWSTESGKLVANYEVGLYAPTAISDDGLEFLVPHGNVVEKRSVFDGQITSTVESQSKQVIVFAAYASNDRLALLTDEGVIQIGDQQALLTPNAKKLVFSRYQSLLAAFGDDEGHVTIFRPEEGNAPISSVVSPRGKVIRLVTFNSAGTKMAFADALGSLFIHDLETGQTEVLEDHGKAMASIEFNKDGSELVAVDKEGGILNIAVAPAVDRAPDSSSTSGGHLSKLPGQHANAFLVGILSTVLSLVIAGSLHAKSTNSWNPFNALLAEQTTPAVTWGQAFETLVALICIAIVGYALIIRPVRKIFAKYISPRIHRSKGRKLLKKVVLAESQLKRNSPDLLVETLAKYSPQGRLFAIERSELTDMSERGLEVACSYPNTSERLAGLVWQGLLFQKAKKAGKLYLTEAIQNSIEKKKKKIVVAVIVTPETLDEALREIHSLDRRMKKDENFTLIIGTIGIPETGISSIETQLNSSFSNSVVHPFVQGDLDKGVYSIDQWLKGVAMDQGSWSQPIQNLANGHYSDINFSCVSHGAPVTASDRLAAIMEMIVGLAGIYQRVSTKTGVEAIKLIQSMA